MDQNRANTTLILQIEQYKPYTMTTNGKKRKQTHTQWEKNNTQINKQKTTTKEKKTTRKTPQKKNVLKETVMSS